MAALWSCPRCTRTFRQVNQAHSCGTGDRDAMLAKKPGDLAALFLKLEKTVIRWPGVEIVYKNRYALFRTTRIFADLVFMKDALRLAILLDRDARDPIFFKVQKMSSRRVAQVTLIRSAAELRAALVYLKEAYHFARVE